MTAILRLSVVGLLLLSGARIAAADYLEPYRRGFHAFNLFRWESCVSEMRKAIGENSVESAKPVHIGLLAWKPYVPHFYLGISLAKLHRCQEAVPALQESLRQGVLPDNYRRRAVETLKDCPVPAARQELPPALHSSPGPSVTKVRETGLKRDEPGTADVALQRPAASLQAEPADREEDAPVTKMEPSAGATDTAVPSAPPGAQQLADSRRALREAIERGRASLKAVPEKATLREAVRLRERLDRVDPATIESVTLLLASTREIHALVGEVEREFRRRTDASPPRAPQSVLVSGIDAYLHGRYADAVRILHAAELAETPRRGQVLLFRAAALHALWVIGHRRDDVLRDRAVRDALDARKLRPAAPADARVFSPMFLQFAEQAVRDQASPLLLHSSRKGGTKR